MKQNKKVQRVQAGGRPAIKVKHGKSEIEVSQETLNAVGRFFAKLVGEPLEDVVGFATDWLKVRRSENAIRLIQAARERLRQRGIVDPSRVLPLKIAHPLLEAASLEEEPGLKEKWANLLANFADTTSGIDLSQSYVEVLRVISPLEARILETVYSQVPRPVPPSGKLFIGTYLPDRAEPVSEKSGTYPPPADPQVLRALSNLKRVNCLSGGTTWDGGEHFGYVCATHFGAAFHDACSDRPVSETA